MNIPVGVTPECMTMDRGQLQTLVEPTTPYALMQTFPWMSLEETPHLLRSSQGVKPMTWGQVKKRMQEAKKSW